ncbi:DNA polymerase III subunit gamma/tau [Candidatus Bipolaricaulota bacterium]|nr:DNA polymerase III subunit gamma/tau [Candidatus Bipolaricaulota bacterium]
MTEKLYHISLYRRFRPQCFCDVVGQDEVIRTLKNAVVAGEAAHAYLFSGERGIGKTSIARILARAVNCLSPEEGEPCNKCVACKTILANRSLDILEIDGASNRGIDNIRRLREEVNFAPTDLRMKVYIIDEVHMLTNEAFNALLKTLEEPPSHAVFIFATTEPHKVPRTIVSRCQAFDFRKIGEETIGSRLAQIACEVGITITAEASALLARKANGGMRDAIVMLEQAMSYAGEEITPEILLDMLGLVGRDVHEKFLRAIETGDRTSVLGTIDSLVERGKDLEVFLADLVGIVRDRLAAGSGSVERDIRLCRGLLDVKQDLFRSLDRRILLEIGLLSLMDGLSGPVSTASSAVAREDGPAAGPPVVEPIATQTIAAKPIAAEEGSLLAPAADRVEERPLPRTEAAPRIQPDAEPAEQIGEEGGFLSGWKKMLQAIEQERIAIAAFLTEATPHLAGDRVTIAFHPEHTFHKESLEKPGNTQYLAGMVHRHLGDRFYVEIELSDGVSRKPSPQATLREKADLVCQLFDGTIIREE